MPSAFFHFYLIFLTVELEGVFLYGDSLLSEMGLGSLWDALTRITLLQTLSHQPSPVPPKSKALGKGGIWRDCPVLPTCRSFLERALASCCYGLLLILQWIPGPPVSTSQLKGSEVPVWRDMVSTLGIRC